MATITQKTAVDLATVFRHIAGCATTSQLTALLKMDYNITAAFSGNQAGKCVTFKTLIDTTDGKKAAGLLYLRGKPFQVYAWDGNKKVIANAHVPFKKEGMHKCYRIEMLDGQVMECADNHRILTHDGYYFVEHLRWFFADLLESSLDISRSAHVSGVEHSTKKGQDSRCCCLKGRHRCDERLLSDADTGVLSFPLPTGVQQRTLSSFCKGGQANKCTYNLSSSLCRLSNQDEAHPFSGQAAESSICVFCTNAQLSMCERITFLQQSSVESDDLLLNILGRRDQCRFFLAYKPPFVCINGNQVDSITLIPTKQEVYDFTVEKYHNYSAGGLIHHNTWSFAYMYFLRILGIHPQERLNCLARKIRCMSPSLPIAGGSEEQDNTQYIEFKQMLPPELIVKDITARTTNLVVRRPDGSNCVLEFKSTNQEMQKLGRVQLSSCWHDEESPRNIRDECKMRLLAEGGDECFSLTPTNALSYTYDEVWQRAEYRYRTPTIQEKFNLPEHEYPNKGTSIGCVAMATDDNPTLDKETIDFIFEDITDPDDLALRRYGVFKQISGRIHKTYDPAICYINFERLFI